MSKITISIEDPTPGQLEGLLKVLSADKGAPVREMKKAEATGSADNSAAAAISKISTEMMVEATKKAAQAKKQPELRALFAKHDCASVSTMDKKHYAAAYPELVALGQ